MSGRRPPIKVFCDGAMMGCAIGCFAAHDREGDARHFVGERDGDKLEGLGLHELLRPGSQRVVVWLSMIKDRMRAHDKQCP